MIVHPDFVFIHLQKTGGSFVEEFLLNNIPNCKQILPRHRSAREVDSKIFKFGCIRNPFKWYVSLWASHIKGDSFFEEILDKDFKKFMYNMFSKKHGKLHDVDFGIMTKLDIGMYTFRYLNCFCSSDNKFILNAVIDTDNINKGLEILFQLDENKKKILDNLNNMKKINTSNHKHYRFYYDKELVKLIEHKDRAIFRSYKYEY